MTSKLKKIIVYQLLDTLYITIKAINDHRLNYYKQK